MLSDIFSLLILFVTFLYKGVHSCASVCSLQENMSLQTFEEKISFIRSHVQSFEDFPKPGILFRDIFSALADGEVCSVLQDVLVEYIKIHFPDVEAIIGLEARGFLFCFSVAAQLKVGCIPIRKKGKLPGKTISYDYVKEYGMDTFEIQADTLKKTGLKCLIVDDLIATGGSMIAGINLLKEAKCEVLGCLAVMELSELKARPKFPRGIKVHSLINY